MSGNDARALLAAALLLVLAAPGLRCAVHDTAADVVFALEGAHAELACSACHLPDAAGPPPTTCSGCHAPDRPSLHWDDECSECHDTWDWRNATFDHDAWELTGAHLDTRCFDCHTGDSWEGLEPSCLACHADDSPPDHMVNECVLCHDTTAWADLHWTHPFPLVGGHDDLLCSACHTDGWSQLSSSCSACHAGDAPPGHRPGQCDDCHSVWNWHDVDDD